ncbi:hypothetical protein [Pseudoroseomonas ludipueritiae]|uniref:Uncharacterized protein n=1 Tax=Pseudoroseomonas ludipueritiae TaxID=198093 RepID=A0ABR7RFG7_9PROT|nr:hypothetical protein [Pseudoroseomonas ludipueritiae]MBC9180222.1 hypothetical protein [Pseudoroseomonas ludipueritiae]
MSAHTPGPWVACGDGNCGCNTIMSSDHPICTFECGDWGDRWPAIRQGADGKPEAFMEQSNYGHVPHDVARANARLISAAPDLLEHGNALVTLIEMCPPGCMIDPEAIARLVANLRAAIAKAQGGRS